jgi:hypothetical protein
MKRALTFRNVAKGAGAAVLTIVALDLVATALTVALGWRFFER